MYGGQNFVGPNEKGIHRAMHVGGSSGLVTMSEGSGGLGGILQMIPRYVLVTMVIGNRMIAGNFVKVRFASLFLHFKAGYK